MVFSKRTPTCRKAANVNDTTVRMSLLLFIFCICRCLLVCARAFLPDACVHASACVCVCVCVFVCVCAEMRPVCLLLSQIAPTRAPKITTKPSVGRMTAPPPTISAQSLLPYCTSEWRLTRHMETGRGRRPRGFDRNKYSHMLMRLLTNLSFSFKRNNTYFLPCKKVTRSYAALAGRPLAYLSLA